MYRDERSLYIAANIASGEVINGEERIEANKRTVPTTIPIDDELAHVLRKWLAVRPDPIATGEPLFMSTSSEWGTRITSPIVRKRVEQYARQIGWYETGGGAKNNVTPHYFRHFFTTHLWDQIGDRGIVEYLRGDSAKRLIDTYNHNWERRAQEAYVDNIYSLEAPTSTE